MKHPRQNLPTPPTVNSNIPKRTTAPPAYRPQPVPKVLQRKVALPQHPILSKPPLPMKPASAAPPVYRPQPVPKVLQRKAATVPPSSPAPSQRAPVAPPVYRPQPKQIVQPKASAFRAPVIQRMEVPDYGYDTDQDDDFQDYEWQTLTERKAVPTLFSYSMVAAGSKPAASEGPHTFASCALRFKYEKIIKAGDWAQLVIELNLLGDKQQVTDLMLEEAPKADAGKLKNYLTAYGIRHAKAVAAVEAKTEIVKAAWQVMKLENMHVYASSSWKSRITKPGIQKACGTGSSKGKGEKIRVGSGGRISATRSGCLIDVRNLDDLSTEAEEHLQHNLSFIFDSPGMSVKTYLDRAGSHSSQKKRDKKRKCEDTDDAEAGPTKKVKVEPPDPVVADADPVATFVLPTSTAAYDFL